MRGPVLTFLLIPHMQQNSEAASARCSAIQLRALRISETVRHGAAFRLCSVSEEPRVLGMPCSLCDKSDPVSRSEDRRVDREVRDRRVGNDELRRLSSTRNSHGKFEIVVRYILSSLHIVKRHVGDVADDAWSRKAAADRAPRCCER